MYSRIQKVLQNNDYSDIPVWLMRQAGRYMQEYHIVKNKFPDFISMCKNSEAVTEITLQPLKKFDLDAAIIFSDILILLDYLDFKVQFFPGKGPVIDNSNLEVRINNTNNRFDKNILSPIYSAIKTVRKELRQINKPLIGFAGSPWTIAAYLIEGEMSKDLLKARRFSKENRALTLKILDTLTYLITEHICEQISSGVELIQIFDTHSNSLDYQDHDLFSNQRINKIITQVKKRHKFVPIFLYSKSINMIGKEVVNTLDGISMNSHYNMESYIDKFPKHICFQGNLDPISLLVGGETMENEIKKILKSMKDKKFIFNLGHGVLQQTPTKNVEKLIKIIREHSSKL
tara:strand:+ start:22 stop:1056 length:1035 start_codon:yes stop_codon:yes gene_type:complete